MKTETLCQIATWKNAELQHYCTAFVTVAVNLLDSGTSYVGSDDVPDQDQPESHAIPGSALTMLRAANVITDFWGSVPAENIHGGRRKSKRTAANGRKIGLYTLTSRGMAVEWLKRNGVQTEPYQLEMWG
jgi:hypothetical protein